MSDTRVTPLDPDSPKGREVAYALTALLDQVEERLAAERGADQLAAPKPA